MDVDYCDFVVWTERDIHIERITPSVEFWEITLNKALKFFTLCILPELLAKWYTRPSQFQPQPNGDEEMVQDDDDEEGPWCYCQTDIEGSKLIGCDNEGCAIKWFHMGCLKLDVVPKGKWFCPTCWINQ